MLRSILFTPGDDRRKIDKALIAGADAVALDLEDAVAYSQKNAARNTVREVLHEPLPQTVFIRINAVATDYILKDLRAVAGLPSAGLMLAKAESAEELGKLDWLLGLLEIELGVPRGATALIPFVESAAGILRAAEIASCPRVKALAFGGVDFSQEIGLNYPEESCGMFFARSQLVLASRAAGIEPPLDAVLPDIKDNEKLAAEAGIAKKLGFQGKLIIHPAQIASVNTVFSPTPEEIKYARKVVAAFEEAEAKGKAVIQVEGKMVEYPMVRRAKMVLSMLNKSTP
jgi:citrate lyase subunit beta/citryl-CoA lyase